MPVFAFMKPKNKKNQNKTRSKLSQEEFFQGHFRISNPVGILYVFLLSISIAYGTLIFYSAKFFDYGENTGSTTIRKTSYRENKIKEVTKGYPVEKMSKYISRMDRKTSAFLLGIAKKESNWGKFSPQKDGMDCYNYWGYRGTYNQTDSGYSCFDSPSQAVAVVGGQIDEFIAQGIDTSRELAVWKCGWDEECQKTPSAKKWIVDVDYYARKF